LEAHAGQDLDALDDRLADGVQRADAGWPARQADVQALTVECDAQLAFANGGLASGVGVFERLLDAVSGLADAGPIILGQLAEAAQQLGQRAALALVGRPPGLQGTRVGSLLELGERGVLDFLQLRLPGQRALAVAGRWLSNQATVAARPSSKLVDASQPNCSR